MSKLLNQYGLAILLLLSVIAFFPGLQNNFTHLDDYVQLVENKSVEEISIENIQTIFSSTTVGMYQPLSTLVYAVSYQIDGANPIVFHALSLFVHLINVVLVFILLKKLSIKKELALILTAIFALHPMQVESISWVSAFSNLLYSCFFLIALIYYRNYQKSPQFKWYLLTLLFFFFSLLSKSTAITLPLILIVLDYFNKQKVGKREVLDKIPLLALSVAFGIITLYSRESAGHLSDLSIQFDWIDRIFLISYSVFFYPFKWIFPIGLSAFYPYPELTNGLLPWFYYAAFGALIILFWALWKNRKNTYLITGFLFYLISISLVLQLIPVGNQLTTDRYLYLPSIGLLLMLYGFIRLINIKKIIPIFSILCILLLMASRERTKVWASDQLIWEDVIDQYPKVAQAYNNLGSYALQKGKLKEAFNYFDQAVQLKPYYADALSNRGNLYSQQGNSKLALNDFNKAIQMRPHADAYFNRANEYVRLGQSQKAVADYQASVQLKPSADSYTNWAYALLQLNDINRAMEKLNQALSVDPNFAQAHFLSGMIYQKQQMRNKACVHFQRAAQLNHLKAKQAVKQFCL